jgi:hypothetical protein
MLKDTFIVAMYGGRAGLIGPVDELITGDEHSI